MDIVKNWRDGSNDNDLVSKPRRSVHWGIVPEPIYKKRFDGNWQIRTHGSLKIDEVTSIIGRCVHAARQFSYSECAHMRQFVRVMNPREFCQAIILPFLRGAIPT